VINVKNKTIGELENFPTNCGYGDVVRLNGELYIVTNEYDSDNPRHEKTKVMFF